MQYKILVSGVMLVALSGCQPFALLRGGSEDGPQVIARQEDAATLNEPHTVSFTHQMPADYVMRTDRVPPAEAVEQSGLANFFAAFTGDSAEKKQSVSALAVVPDRHQQAVALTDKVAFLAGELVAMGREHLDPEDAVTVSTFVNLGDLYRTSSLGRFIGEQLISSLKKAGYGVIEVRKPAAILVRERFGEYGLSRDMDELSFVHQARAMVVGTYNRAAGQVFVNARLVSSDDGVVLAASSLVLEEDQFVAELLRDEAAPMMSQRTSSIGITGQ